jgi:mono/diheme cytochrome c family protein
MTRMTILAAALMYGPAAAAHAEGAGRVQQGRALAQRICAECHAVLPGDRRSPNEDAPPFTTIAATPGMTTIALTAALHTSHRTMPNILLQPNETADVIAYILSLKDGN